MRKQKRANADQHWWRHRRAHGCEAWQDAGANGVRYRRCRKASLVTYFEWRGEVAGWHRAEGPRKPKAPKQRHQIAVPKPDPYGQSPWDGLFGVRSVWTSGFETNRRRH